MTQQAPRLPSAAALDAATPPDRDRWADALRVGSLLVVIAGHWLVVVLLPDGTITNALSIVPSLQPLTWVLQVMPLFFLVGGVAHAHTLASAELRGGTRRGRYAAFYRARALRLLRPSLVFLGVWVALGVVLHVVGLTAADRGAEGRLVRDALVAVPQLLWFVGIYLGASAFAPLMLRLHRRLGLAVVAGLALVAVAADVPRLVVDAAGVGGPVATVAGFLANLNFVFVWLALHQLGFAWADGMLTRPRGWFMLAGGFGVMLLLVTAGPYPVSMVGLPGADVSNMAPPTPALLAQGIGIIGAAVVLREPMRRVLARPRAWRLVVMAGPYAMTAFLWHLTALMLVLLALRGLGIEQPPVASLLWWLTRPLLFAALVVVTAALVAIFVRFDRGPRHTRGVPAETRTWVDPVAAVSALVTFFGILMVSVVGVDLLGNRGVFFLVGDVTPTVAFAVLGVGLGLLALARPRVRDAAG